MALRVQYNKKLHGVMLRSGHVYSFKYRAWRNDPTPTIILMYAFRGTHPNTGRQWRFIQAVNFTYLPKAMRKAFANEWVKVFDQTGGNVRFTYKILERRYPFMKFAIRRYFYSPTYYISKLKHIPFEQMEDAIVSTWSKDFSKKVKTSMLQKFRNVMKDRRKIKKQAKKSAKKYGIKI